MPPMTRSCAATTHTVVSATPQGTGPANQASGGGRGASGSARNAFRSAFGGPGQNARGEPSAIPNETRHPIGRASGTKLPAPSFARVTRTAAGACIPGDDTSTELRLAPSEPCQSLGPTRIPTIQTAVAIAITSSRIQQRFTLSQVTSPMPALPAHLAHRILDGLPDATEVCERVRRMWLELVVTTAGCHPALEITAARLSQRIALGDGSTSCSPPAAPSEPRFTVKYELVSEMPCGSAHRLRRRIPSDNARIKPT